MRLDTTTELGAAWAKDHNHAVDNDDPGASDVIDLCFHCAHNEGVEDVANVDHPVYEYGNYYCANCGQALDDTNDF